MKTFDEFVSTLTPDQIIEITENANKIAVNIANSVPDQKEHTLIAVTAFQTSLGLLQKYHEWLNQ